VPRRIRRRLRDEAWAAEKSELGAATTDIFFLRFLISLTEKSHIFVVLIFGFERYLKG
jgi:hypothetical protein